MTYQTREEYLTAFIEAARPRFEAVNAAIPPNVRIAVGFTSKGGRGRVIGECWSSDSSADGHYEIFIKPTLTNAAQVCEALTHQLVHCAVGIENGYNQTFKRVAASLGLVGKMKEAKGGPDWYAWALPIIESLGEMPYAALDGKLNSGRKKQKTYLLKIECPSCGWLAQVTKKHLTPHEYLECPVPGCPSELICVDAD